MVQRAAIEVSGLVQGVGFRPFVHSLASGLALNGFVQNRGTDLFIDVEGPPDELRRFVEQLTARAPAAARIDRVQCRALAPAHHQRFVIAGSDPQRQVGGTVPPDVATCAACVEELFDPADRRHRHPFIACTACGPRFSIIQAMPYDRGRTTMSAFPWCEACRAEYLDPGGRRFHAQAIACPQCGPVLAAHRGAGMLAQGETALRLAASVLADGGIVAVKGLGGFHLACDAASDAAVAELRRRKGREARPFALMVSDAAGRLMAEAAGPGAVAALTSAARPIVLIDRAAAASAGLSVSAAVAPGCPAVGVLLPYTPIHHLLLADLARPLVMTSGNRSDEPMVCDDAAAVDRLGAIADLFLTHDRRIETRCDDSVVRAHETRVMPVRRARGYAPAPLGLAERAPVAVLGVGAHLKNAFCLAAGAHAYVSPHVGTLESAASYEAFGATVGQFTELLKIQPELVGHDRHPDYLSTRYALSYPAAQRVAVQHHHAHVLSCVAEHQCTEPVIGVAFDGAGLGVDGAVWGGEFLIVDGVSCVRAAHLAYVPLPGGDAAAREPWRMAVAHLRAACGPGLGAPADAITDRVPAARVEMIMQMMAKGVCSPPTSSMGRLFDAVAALTGLRDTAVFEGQAAMELEAAAGGAPSRPYAFDYESDGSPWTIDAAPVIRAVAADVAAGRRTGEIAASFHHAVAAMVGEVAARVARATGIRRVALSGGVFQNARLARGAAAALAARDLDVLEHRHVPCNDGGLALGQALYVLRAASAGIRSEDRIACA